MAITFGANEAKAQWSRLLALAESGEQIEITRHGQVIAFVTGAWSATRQPGSGIGTVQYSDAPFDLTDSEIDDMFHSKN